ncbi:MAG: Hsp70 family protein [Pseudomonadota bacterium]
MSSDTLAIDFGTSNSAAAILSAGEVRRIAIEHGADTLPTAVFFPPDGAEMLIGEAATKALIEREDGRYMRALKSVLGSALFHEKRPIMGKFRTIGDIVAEFLIAIRERCEAETGTRYTKVLSGRPVRFHSLDQERDQRAEDDLRACYHAAGFEEVRFLVEPEAAAVASHHAGGHNGLGLIVDIGGGTSDFTVYRHQSGRPDVLANHGIRLGGTDFDYSVSLTHAMPALGLGGQLRRPMGGGLVPVQRGPFVDLATWSQIPFLYTAENRRMVAEMVRQAVEPGKIARLGTVLELELGHELAFAVERAKISVNETNCTNQLELGYVESGLAQPVEPEGLESALDDSRSALGDAMRETIAAAGTTPDKIQQVVLVGGSSLMRFVVDGATSVCPEASVVRSEAFTAVVDGLALATAH